MSAVKKGDRYVFVDAHGQNAVFIKVTRVSCRGGWVDIRCCTWASSWSKRMPIGLSPDWVRVDWGLPDLDAQEARWDAER